MTISVLPTLDSNGENWVVHLTNFLDDAAVASEGVDDNGIWKGAGLAPADYRLRLLDSLGHAVYHDVLTLHPASNHFEVRLETVLVEGTVSLGETPLVAELTFGGRRRAVSISMESDELGQFSGILPRDGHWSVDVVSQNPRIYRRLSRVQVGPAVDGAASVDIELPDSLIQGEVVYESNRPAPNAKIILVPLEVAERVTTLDADEDGSFEIRGHAPGRYKIEAHGRGSKRTTSNSLIGEVKEATPWTGIKLVLRELVPLRGQVVSADSGHPIPGALVLPESVPGQTEQVGILPQRRADENGRFLFELPRGLRRIGLNVLALGFIFEKVEIDVARHADEVRIPIFREGGGSLRFQFQTANQGLERALEGERIPVIYSDKSITYSISFLRLWAKMQGSSSQGRELVIPQMPQGVYYVCWRLPFEAVSAPFGIGGAGADCEGKILSPGDEVWFKDPAEKRTGVD